MKPGIANQTTNSKGFIDAANSVEEVAERQVFDEWQCKVLWECEEGTFIIVIFLRHMLLIPCSNCTITRIQTLENQDDP